MQRRFHTTLLAAVCAVVCCSPGAFARPDPSGDPLPPGVVAPVPKLESAKAQLDHAALLKTAMRGTEGEARVAARRLAIEGYRSVREHFAGDSAACAEASFRAGELLRAAGDLAGAASEFVLARDRGLGTAFRVRAMLEIGHLERRAKHHEGALAAYEAVIAEESTAPGQKDEASLWAGRVHVDLGRPADARRVWQRVAEGAVDPLDRIRAFDSIASLLVDQGDLEGAAGVLERCRESLSDTAQEESKLGERVRNALSGMRAVDELAIAVQKRKATEDKPERVEKPMKRVDRP